MLARSPGSPPEFPQGVGLEVNYSDPLWRGLQPSAIPGDACPKLLKAAWPETQLWDTVLATDVADHEPVTVYTTIGYVKLRRYLVLPITP